MAEIRTWDPYTGRSGSVEVTEGLASARGKSGGADQRRVPAPFAPPTMAPTDQPWLDGDLVDIQAEADLAAMNGATTDTDTDTEEVRPATSSSGASGYVPLLLGIGAVAGLYYLNR